MIGLSPVSHNLFLVPFFLVFLPLGLTRTNALIYRTSKHTTVLSTETTVISSSPSPISAVNISISKPKLFNVSVTLTPTPSISISPIPNVDQNSHTASTPIPYATVSLSHSRSPSSHPFLHILRQNHPRRSLAVIRLWTLNPATLLVNGIPIAVILSPDGGELLQSYKLGLGDVIAVSIHFSKSEIREKMKGIALSLKLQNNWFVISPNLARAKFVSSLSSQKDWASPKHDMCSWSQAREIPVSSASEIGKEVLKWRVLLDMMMTTSAKETKPNIEKEKFCKLQPSKFIAPKQDDHEKSKDYALIRLKIGGDQCGDEVGCMGQSCPEDNRNKNSDVRKANVTKNERYSGKCRCKRRNEMISNDKSNGECFSFTGNKGTFQGKRKGVCKTKKCQTAFECVENGINHTNWCIRKYVEHRVVPIKKWYSGQFLCDRVPLQKRNVFLVPFA